MAYSLLHVLSTVCAVFIVSSFPHQAPPQRWFGRHLLPLHLAACAGAAQRPHRRPAAPSGLLEVMLLLLPPALQDFA